MRYEYRLLQFEMHRLVRAKEFQNPVANRDFWAFVVGVYAFLPVSVVADVLDEKYNSRKVLIRLLVAVTLTVFRFAYITIRRLLKVEREWGSFCASAVYGVEFHSDRIEVSHSGHTHSYQWNAVELSEKPEFLVFTLDKSWACPVPRRVVPPDELPRLLAFLRERIPAIPEPPPPLPFTPPVPPGDVAAAGD